MEELAKLTLEEFLEKLGAGKPVPGSGSTAALMGWVSSKMIQTVVKITSRREEYKEVMPELNQILVKVKDLDTLAAKLLQDDSDQFDRYMTAMRASAKEVYHPRRKWELADKAVEELRYATLIALDIAEKCLEIADFALAIYDSGYDVVRGDSQVAVDAAIAGATSAISIVFLNIKHLEGGQWESNILKTALDLDERAQKFQAKLPSRREELKMAAIDACSCFKIKPTKLRSPVLLEKNLSFEQIEQIAGNIRRDMWNNRNDIWDDEKPQTESEIFSPETAFDVIGYTFEKAEFLGQTDYNGKLVDVAGYINGNEKRAAVSGQFPLVIQNFTAAHELGHALLHRPMRLHRDRALDGSSVGSRPRMELEADKFAVYFLMPENAVREVFRHLFATDRLVISADVAHALNTSEQALKNISPRKLARFIASADYYEGVYFESLMSRFLVSEAAMAIRLEELDLLEF